MPSSRLFATLNFDLAAYTGSDLTIRSPRDGQLLATLKAHTTAQAETALADAQTAFLAWREVPAPVRGELVRVLGEVLREHRQALGELVTQEAGKILSEGLGEVQEMIDICDFAVGLSRQLHGLTIASERPGHRMMETWHPLGVCGVITAFNFPVAVWAWNAALALICGNAVVWKPSEKTPVVALAVQALFAKAVERFSAQRPNVVPANLCQILIGRAEIGEVMSRSPLVPLVSATGSVRMGRKVATVVAERLGRSLLELGGNNAMIVAPTADLSLALRAITFSAVGTAGQRCTSLRRLFVHSSIHDQVVAQIKRIYASVKVGDPLLADTLVGPLIDKAAYDAMQSALQQARGQGGEVTGGERIDVLGDGVYVRPALVCMPGQTAIMHHETFAPILYVVKYDELADAIALNNAVPQGLSSAIFTNDVREAETFVSAVGSDCGLANVNIGTSGAEIGGAFGGEKETGGGRESGSDAWKNYMRRATNTINYSKTLPLAQGVKFDID
ncbi:MULTISPECIES: aldehyde dehydrogenase family protein [unclassified Herbaspirillum]|uniref:L-piperidine-6-carboxylate dehydrogenase n=1 Tax=unclassified Herbaspirillum TaxID=2624150 RepID=UPI000E2F055D|nr:MULTISPECIES: aldehyde dehydrogenase family protein [unclassified Herbaspirillum]RFB74063.1 aldehyde dehydrogenase family protein [Herbaspirillum sp. 3R-3a1]TFI10123.1 aldehyde dehydrogenase family protein [Herbaspirillum sp. 3R11]TFI16028.1 aldehyde dehydrogenase family protein [Herbaspirillum sp. 3R-11]TFI30460.1 aldehyde dehydrogenase family protein [Herbaspirillum sp. 3C11]